VDNRSGVFELDPLDVNVAQFLRQEVALDQFAVAILERVWKGLAELEKSG
jgi:hypothetical protein